MQTVMQHYILSVFPWQAADKKNGWLYRGNGNGGSLDERKLAVEILAGSWVPYVGRSISFNFPHATDFSNFVHRQWRPWTYAARYNLSLAETSGFQKPHLPQCATWRQQMCPMSFVCASCSHSLLLALRAKQVYQAITGWFRGVMQECICIFPFLK